MKQAIAYVLALEAVDPTRLLYLLLRPSSSPSPMPSLIKYDQFSYLLHALYSGKQGCRGTHNWHGKHGPNMSRDTGEYKK